MARVGLYGSQAYHKKAVKDGVAKFRKVIGKLEKSLKFKSLNCARARDLLEEAHEKRSQIMAHLDSLERAEQEDENLRRQWLPMFSFFSGADRRFERTIYAFNRRCDCKCSPAKIERRKPPRRAKPAPVEEAPPAAAEQKEAGPQEQGGAA